MLVDAAAATGVETVDDDQRVDDEEDSEDDGAAGEFHFDSLSWVEPGDSNLGLRVAAFCEREHKGRARP
jgi:hypothetical protein